VLTIAGEAFAAGVRAGLRLDAALAAAGLLLALLTLRRASIAERPAANPRGY
jgi:hypothetical protein